MIDDERMMAFAKRMVERGTPMNGPVYLCYGDTYHAGNSLPLVTVTDVGLLFEARAARPGSVVVCHGDSIGEALDKLERELTRTDPDPASPPTAPKE